MTDVPHDSSPAPAQRRGVRTEADLADPAYRQGLVALLGVLAYGELVGFLDAEGRLHLVGRANEMYIRGGYNVYPAEVEGALGILPAVDQVAVVGTPDPVLGEIGVAFVVPADGTDPDPDALLADLRYARTEAINRGQLVSLCPSSDGSKCTADGTAWDAGWLVYTYPAGAASANAAYAAGNILLRAGAMRPDVTIEASTVDVVSFGQQGQLRPGTALKFRTCIRASGSGAGENSAAVPGAQLDLSGSGSLASKPLATGDACTP